ncbi:VCBS repeat-containing protein [Micrococcus sp. TA1]|uniref:FG-GAP repeat domain-containing protein n=1 Tax=Micrococcus sp. TA1 TaxID=681627 RepID=UPI0016189F7B|nr:VCBS repeat-containing protein [Micrococcus sp. TA1]MBB5747944.1 inosine/xanthosine triphosphate pyrophosphatase family protein [Micrococcus sp. TA1]
MKHLYSTRFLAVAATATLSMTMGGAPAISDVSHRLTGTSSSEQTAIASSPSLRRDVNGDGRADIVGFGNAGVYVATGNTNGTFTSRGRVLNDFGYDAGGWRVEKNPRQLADVNGDGRADIVGFGNAGVYVATGNTNGTFTSRGRVLNDFGYDAGGWRVEKNPRQLADVNGDGRADIVGFGNAGVYVATGNTNGTFTSRGRVLNDFGYDAGGWRVEKNPRQLADVNGDGRADIVGFGNAGVYVATGNTNGTFTSRGRVLNDFGYDAGGWRVEKNPRQLADVNGDGRADIVGFGNAGVYVANGRSNGTFTLRSQMLANFGYDAGGWRVEKNPRQLADVNGDGRADIVGFGNAGVYVATYNTKTTFVLKPGLLPEFGASADAGGWRVDRHPRFLAGDSD